ncbi:DUF2147 domain-containing protein [Sphingomonas xinjiangensis]|uniref:Uncharacterized protein (DUF2147 family) n=1 Tax=Sphingomonas xinjiangensis TaxID=643568 RepID=A0A840YTA6_9SPHN|nr:DUF2147 domain-containing protein [Sphingomonas xinjiangensis]MBB5712951.1 uncharacterized protein (DUF2147 family) [Sphingomonas xinjiangensis]
MIACLRSNFFEETTMLKTVMAPLLLGALASSGTGISAASAQVAAASPLVGVWHAQDGSLKIEMFDAGGSYSGRRLYGRRVMEADGRSFTRDVHNPDPALRARSLQNVMVVKGLKWNPGSRRWEGGSLYDGSSGRTYSAHVELENGKMELRGYVGSPMLGRTVIFNRVAG